MLDFVSIVEQHSKNETIVYPEFIVGCHSKDLMIKGRAFYAVWDEKRGFWSKNEEDVSRMVDDMIFNYIKEHPIEGPKHLKLMKNFSSNKWIQWQKYCKSLPDNFHELDSKVTFSNGKKRKEDYVTRTLDYPLKKGLINAYEELISTLYDAKERQKLEWAIGSIISGDSKKIQKFIVLYGGPGTGKSTVLNIIQTMFPGYYSMFESKALASSNNSFALEAFRDNPLIAIEHDGDLSRIEDNTKLNSIISHESISVNEKFKATYVSHFHSFLFVGTNKPVKITDAKSGILRRLIDVHPTGDLIQKDRFEQLKNQINFELSGIAYHCLQVYKKLGPNAYDRYVPSLMIGATNDFYNFIEDNYDFFSDDEGIALKTAWLRYKEYCEDARIQYPLAMRMFKYELRNYFREFHERYEDRRSVYLGFMKEKFQYDYNANGETEDPKEKTSWISFNSTVSLLDEELKDCPAQYANEEEKPKKAWDNVKTKMKNINSKKLHYVLPPRIMIVIDFDLKDEKGEKSYEKNLEAASFWPPTYCELSKSGSGIHLHYYYDGDPSELARVISPDIEVKVFIGNASLRRLVTKCNDLKISTISSGMLLKERKSKVITDVKINSEKGLRCLIEKNLRKEIHPNTAPSVSFILQILDDCYEQGLKYDVTDMRSDIQSFALRSSHQAENCLKMVSKMKFRSEEPSDDIPFSDSAPIVFFDVECFPNLFLVVWKKQGKDQKKIIMFNPKPSEVEELFKFRLVGFNVRKYDNHMLYARSMGYTEEELYELSKRIINNDKDAFFGEAYNISYTDIYDYLSAKNKMSLKKWEIKLCIHHQELGLPWDQPVPKHLWPKVGEYCCYDVDATEAVWDNTQEDFRAREILAEWAGMTPNTTTNTLTTKLIVGDDPNPQRKFVYTDLSTIFPGYEFNQFGIDRTRYDEGVKIVKGKSIYMGKDPGEGGYAIGYSGVYYNVAVLDVESMHPHSAMALNIFGEYTKNFSDIVNARLMIKHGEYDLAREVLPKKLEKYLQNPEAADELGNALKTPIVSVYGLTSASFDNRLRDPRNKDNIVAKYGALFMITLENEVKKRGYTVVHIKTDSIKIANADPEIIKFVNEFGKKYGYIFEHESTYSKICLVNDAVYIAKYENPEKCEKMYGYVPKNNKKHPGEWTATGTQFQIPYVFKTLFSKEKVEFKDLRNTFSVTTSLYLDFNETLQDISEEEKELDKLEDLYKKGKISDTLFEEKASVLEEEISKGHDYHFVGKVGCFCPIKPGNNAGILLRKNDKNGKYYAANGTKKKDGSGVYRWMEDEMVKQLGLEKEIDISYYNELANDAIAEISKYIDFDRFISDEDLSWMQVPNTVEEELPFSLDTETFPINKPA